MKLDNLNKEDLIKKLFSSRLRILNNYGFYGIMLMNVKYSLDPNCDTAYTDGSRICIGPNFLNELNEKEVDFVLMHEIMHIALGHCFRGKELDNYLFNIACDIVVNSNIAHSRNDDFDFISLKGEPLMHKTPKGEEGYLYTAEEVYLMLMKNLNRKEDNNTIHNLDSNLKGGLNRASTNKNKDKGEFDYPSSSQFDNHDHWQQENDELKREWQNKIVEAYDLTKDLPASNVPLGIERLVENLKNPKINWLVLLNDFLSFENNDYSFNPPDRRYQDTDFFLPDFNELDEGHINVIFEVDTSASISKIKLSEIFSEVKNAISRFGNRMKGYLFFTDAKIYEPIYFEDVTDLESVKPKGGGGTDFCLIFNKIDEVKAKIERIDAIIILTDGEGKFVSEEASQGIPVLWIINNQKITPPWGIVARL